MTIPRACSSGSQCGGVGGVEVEQAEGALRREAQFVAQVGERPGGRRVDPRQRRQESECGPAVALGQRALAPGPRCGGMCQIGHADTHRPPLASASWASASAAATLPPGPMTTSTGVPRAAPSRRRPRTGSAPTGRPARGPHTALRRARPRSRRCPTPTAGAGRPVGWRGCCATRSWVIDGSSPASASTPATAPSLNPRICRDARAVSSMIALPSSAAEGHRAQLVGGDPAAGQAHPGQQPVGGLVQAQHPGTAILLNGRPTHLHGNLAFPSVVSRRPEFLTCGSELPHSGATVPDSHRVPQTSALWPGA